MRNTGSIAIRPREAWRDTPYRFGGRAALDDIEFLEHLANWLDTAFRVPGLGWRFGLDAVLDLIPGIGDVLGMLASLFIFQAARRYRLPRITVVRMAMNIGIDFLGGLLPVVGPVFDAYWKANIWNVALLKRHLAATPKEARARGAATHCLWRWWCWR